MSSGSWKILLTGKDKKNLAETYFHLSAAGSDEMEGSLERKWITNLSCRVGGQCVNVYLLLCVSFHTDFSPPPRTTSDWRPQPGGCAWPDRNHRPGDLVPTSGCCGWHHHGLLAQSKPCWSKSDRAVLHWHPVPSGRTEPRHPIQGVSVSQEGGTQKLPCVRLLPHR